MAIDSFNKKLSLISFMQPYNCPVPSSNNGLDRADLYFFIWDYARHIIEQITELLITGNSLKTGASISENFTLITPKIGTIGVKFRLNFGESLESATLKRIDFEDPKGNIIQKTGEIHETSYLECVTNSETDLTREGDWKAAIFVESPYFSGYGGTFMFRVKNAFG